MNFILKLIEVKHKEKILGADVDTFDINKNKQGIVVDGKFHALLKS